MGQGEKGWWKLGNGAEGGGRGEGGREEVGMSMSWDETRDEGMKWRKG